MFMKLNEINSLKEYDFSCIYLWTNIVNNKKYVGQTRSFYKRMSQYKKGNFNKYMGNAINKYGLENFDITILEKDVDFYSLDEREQYWLDFYKSYESENGYNICHIASSTFGFKHSDKTKEELSNMVKQRYVDNPELVQMLQSENNPMYGKKHSDEWRKEHSEHIRNKWENKEYRKIQTERMIGENNPMYGVRLTGELNGMHGKTHNQETRDKISANLKHKRKVKCIETGVIYDSITQASRLTNITRIGIGAVCRKKLKTSGGLHWEYLNN